MNTLALALLAAIHAANPAPDSPVDAPTPAAAERFTLAPIGEFRLDLSLLVQPPTEQPAIAGTDAAAASQPADSADPASPPAQPTTDDADPARPGYASAGTTWLTFGGAYASNFDEDHDINLHVAWSKFLADRFEFSVEAAAWYFDQEGENTAGLSGMMIIRYHFWTGPKGDYDWTAFMEGGSGLLVGLDEVPDGGTGFNFIQRAGFGMTKDLDSSDGANHGARLLFGLRWHHISNGRISGDARNPSRDSLLAWVGVVIEF